ncbi:hypothetical protein FFWV33_02220 [Flavobacterium faecale]|uniref:Rieske domain-containing protein n=1 Tax=Flavobacterium faecale TaxID=1355330 RepID=A0A2S1L9M9_9FLAO|nr:hypothetical protein [Flavobacterium faecale]AWG20427.1 hypothetical protein FFWV33_02220 [Flavobacterium faecale]
MKKALFLVFTLAFLSSCSTNGVNNNNPFIPNYSINLTINTDLPAYSNLKFVSNSIYYAGVGAKGIYIFNTGSGYNAFDAACPNQAISACSTMTVNGINLVCPCDSEEYSLFTGLSTLKYPLKQYRVEVNGNSIRVYN